MRNKDKVKLRQRNAEFKKHLAIAYEFMNSNYPGWKNGKKKDVDYIKLELNKTAKKWQNNRFKKKTKILYKKDFSDWPFISDSIILMQTSNLWISCIIKHKNGIGEYALNGLAEQALKLKFPHDCGLAIKGKSVRKFIELGMKL